jgi:hypothetical protein
VRSNKSPRPSPIKDKVFIAQVEFLQQNDQNPAYSQFINHGMSVSERFADEVDRDVDETIELHSSHKESYRPAAQGGFRDIFNTPKKALQPPQ